MSWLDGLSLEDKQKAYDIWQQGRVDAGYPRSTFNLAEWEQMEREIEEVANRPEYDLKDFDDWPEEKVNKWVKERIYPRFR